MRVEWVTLSWKWFIFEPLGLSHCLNFLNFPTFCHFTFPHIFTVSPPSNLEEIFMDDGLMKSIKIRWGRFCGQIDNLRNFQFIIHQVSDVTHQVDHLQVFLICSLCHQDFFCDEIRLVCRMALKWQRLENIQF